MKARQQKDIETLFINELGMSEQTSGLQNYSSAHFTYAMYN